MFLITAIKISSKKISAITTFFPLAYHNECILSSSVRLTTEVSPNIYVSFTLLTQLSPV